MPSDQSHQNIGQSVGAKLRAARLAKKYTQSQLARPDFSVSYISAIERGQIHPSLRALEILALRLGLTSTDLLQNHSLQDGNSTSKAGTPVRSEEDFEWQFLAAQIAIWQGEAQRAITQLRKLTGENLNVRQQMHLRYLLGWAYANTAQLQESEYVLSEAEQLAKDPNDEMGLQILNLLGLVYASMHNYAQGLEYHQRCLAMLENMQPLNPFLMAQVYTNMGLHYTYLNKFDQAVEMFQRALTVTAKLTALQDLKSMYWTMFQQYNQAQEYRLAHLYGYKWLHIHSQEYSQSLRSELYFYLGRAMLHMNQDEAYAYLEKALAEVAALQDQLALASVMTHLAAWLLAHQRVDEAHIQAEEAYTLASSFGETMIAAEALLTLGKIAYAQQDYEAGDTFFVDGLTMLEHLGALEELADQSAAYAQLLEERGEPGKAIFNMRQAYACRQKMHKYTQEQDL